MAVGQQAWRRHGDTRAGHRGDEGSRSAATRRRLRARRAHARVQGALGRRAASLQPLRGVGEMVVPESLPPPQRFAFARDRREWAAELNGLDVGRDGYLTLMALPGPPDGDPIVLPGPYDAGASGIAAGPCGIVFVADTAHHRIVFVDTRCKARVLIPPSGKPSSTPGGFNLPRGLAVSGVALGVADSG